MPSSSALADDRVRRPDDHAPTLGECAPQPREHVPAPGEHVPAPGERLRRRNALARIGTASLAPAVRSLAAGRSRAAGRSWAAARSRAAVLPLADPGMAGPPLVPDCLRFRTVPSASTTEAEDREQMLWQVGVTLPALPPRAAEDPRYPGIPLLETRDGKPVHTPEDWWARRRPEILWDVQNTLYGAIPPRELWPHIIWDVGPATTGIADGVAYSERLITGIIDVSGFPYVRNVPQIQGLLRVPLATEGVAVPIIIVYGGGNEEWQHTAPYGYGVCSFNWAALQPDSGGANLSSYLIGLVGQGHWRRPCDWGTLAAWSWGISRLIDYFETDPNVDASRIGIQGEACFGKAALVAAAYDARIGSVFPSCAGALGNSGAGGEYHRLAGNAMRYCGELTPGAYWPWLAAQSPVDAHSVMSLVAPRPVLANAGTGIPAGGAGPGASQVWELLGWRRQGEGHTPPVPDWPAFMSLTSRHFDRPRPVILPRQHFTVSSDRLAVGTVQASQPGRGVLGNWQLTGGTGLDTFTIDRETGRLRLRDARSPAPAGRRRRLTLTVVVDNQSLTSRPETVTIDQPGYC